MIKLTPDQQVNIVAMREAGYTHNVIATKNRCSLASVKRVCSRYGAHKGAITKELIKDMRIQLRQTISGNDTIKEIAASVVLDTKFHCEQLSEKLSEAMAKLEINTPEDAKAAFKSLQSCANTLKLSADAMRSALKIDTSESYEEDELPTLVVQTLSEEDVKEIRRQQEAEEAELYGHECEAIEILDSEVVEYH